MPSKPAQPKSAKVVDKKSKKESKESKKPKSVEKAPKKVSAKKVEEPEVEDEVDVSDVDSPSSQDDVKKKRRVPTKDSVNEGFDELVSSIDEEIQRLRESSGKAKGVKFLRSFGKKVKTLHSHTARLMKQKVKTNRKNNTNSGFLKPVQLSKEMAKFTGWDHNELKSRVDVTKYICNYIRENKLQNPEDRRQILADKKLSKLLDYSADDDKKPLTYYRIQTYMKKHFTNPSKSDEVSA
jgi:upstream activation factor subunit UAF30